MPRNAGYADVDEFRETLDGEHVLARGKNTWPDVFTEVAAWPGVAVRTRFQNVKASVRSVHIFSTRCRLRVALERRQNSW